jgi:hypothetical protein
MEKINNTENLKKKEKLKLHKKLSTCARKSFKTPCPVTIKWSSFIILLKPLFMTKAVGRLKVVNHSIIKF